MTVEGAIGPVRSPMKPTRVALEIGCCRMNLQSQSITLQGPGGKLRGPCPGLPTCEDGRYQNTSIREVAMKTFLNTNEVAMFLGRSPKAIRKLVERGQLPHRRLGRRVIFVQQELEQFIQDLPGMNIQDIQRRWNHL